MIHMDNEVEIIAPPAEAKEESFQVEEVEEEEAVEVGEEDDLGNEEEVQVDGDEEEREKKEEAPPLGAGETEKNVELPVRATEKKSSEGLNLNNEVVRMRKEVKRVRALIIRKLTRQFGALKKKKGKETEIEKNQRRAARLLEEIHALKALSPDMVTKRALQKKINFEQVCKDPKSPISNRAIARIATHPQFNKKIEEIKAAVKNFKEERMNGGKQAGEEKAQNRAGKVVLLQPPDKKGEGKSEKVADMPVVRKKILDNKGGDGIIKNTPEATSTEPGKETEKATNSADIVSQRKEISESEIVRAANSSRVKDAVGNSLQKPNIKCAPEELQKKKVVEESDLESPDEEDKKEYFDDSTEERFHRQSSQSEESDDDFFIGKVSKYTKKKKQRSTDREKSREVRTDPTHIDRSKLDELESRLKSKATSLQSVFCSSLSASKPGSGRERRGRGKQRGDAGPRGDFSKQEKGTEVKSRSEFSKSELPQRGFRSVGRGRGRGRGDGTRQNDRTGGGVSAHQATKPALHPSWEASKKRKEQQGRILAFQGKKIKFDDDDD